MNRTFFLLIMLSWVVVMAAQDRFEFVPKDTAQQREYDEFLSATKAECELADSLAYLEAVKFFDFNGDEEPLKPYVAQKEKARQRRDQAIERFVEQHPRYAVSAAYVKYMYYQYFKYTARDYDYFVKLVSACPDTSYTNFLARNHEFARRHSRGADFTDFAGREPQGGEKRLSQLMQEGKYTLVDFWASWCGPCRRAIPRLKALAERYADRLQVVSASVDEKEEAWHKARQEEDMPWPQLWLGKEYVGMPVQAYMIQSIPRLVLISPDGKVVCVTHLPAVIEQTMVQAVRVSAEIPGVMSGAEVKLVTSDGTKSEVARALAADGRFTIDCLVRKPTYVQLKINDKATYTAEQHPQDRGVELCLQPGYDVTVSATCYDSIPRSWEMNGTPLLQEPNVSIDGGPCQQHLAEYRAYIRQAALDHWRANQSWRQAEYGIGQKVDHREAERLEPAVKAAERQLRLTTERFMYEHPDYGVTLRLQLEQLDNLFKYADEELDQMLVRYRENEDSLMYEQLQKQVAALRHYTRGKPYTDLTIETTDRQQRQLSSFMVPGRYTLIDFWASWCGPCRAAIPKMKALTGQMGERLQVLSVSVDRDRKAWLEAVGQEQMAWPQLLVPQSLMQQLNAAYRVTSIPFLILVSDEGRILMSTHSIDDISERLSAAF